MQYDIINHSHHAVHYIPLTYFITASLYLLTPFTSSPSHFWQPPTCFLCIYELGQFFVLFLFCDHLFRYYLCVNKSYMFGSKAGHSWEYYWNHFVQSPCLQRRKLRFLEGKFPEDRNSDLMIVNLTLFSSHRSVFLVIKAK